MTMKRLALALGTLLLSIQLVGCGGGASDGGLVTGPPSDESNLPDEVKAEMQRERDIAKKAQERDAAKKAKAAKH